ncbi:hypothetical protein MY1884_002080 [Beauveria asiatica]
MFEPVTATWQCIVACPETRKAVVIDPVLDFDLANLKLTTQSADELLRIIREHGYTIDYLLETHAHADHLTAAAHLQQELHRSQGSRPPVSTGHRIRQGVPQAELDAAFDKLFVDDEAFAVGRLTAVALHLPGHTPDHSGYRGARNKHVKDGTEEDEFVRWRRERDAGLKEPRLLHPALQTNIRGGRLAETGEGSGITFLSLPVQMPFRSESQPSAETTRQPGVCSPHSPIARRRQGRNRTCEEIGPRGTFAGTKNQASKLQIGAGESPQFMFI